MSVNFRKLPVPGASSSRESTGIRVYYIGVLIMYAHCTVISTFNQPFIFRSDYEKTPSGPLEF